MIYQLFWACSFHVLNNFLSYGGLVDARISASEKDLPVLTNTIWCFLFSAKQIKTPKFDGSGYLSFTMPETKSIRHITSFSLELKTTSIDGMILWIGQDLSSDDYLGVGIRKGMVHLVWNLGKWPKHIVSLCVLLIRNGLFLSKLVF